MYTVGAAEALVEILGVVVGASGHEKELIMRCHCRSAVMILALPLIGFGQSDTAQVSGFVKDSSGSGVPKASIAVANEKTGLERRTTTNDSGYYIVTSVPTGTYTITAEAPGFKRAQTTQNHIESNLAATIDITLEVGAISERVEVVGSAARLQSDTASLGKVVDREQILNI